MPRRVHLWTKEKLLILERYLPEYLSATTTARDRVFVDAFAGPGTNLVEENGQIVPGSPLIAARAAASNGTKFSRYVFIDNDPSNIQELKECLSKERLSAPVELICADVNTALPETIRSLNRRAPTFVFLDTEGIEPKWTTLEKIAPWRVEFLINFPLGMGIKRNQASPKTLDYFGTKECLPLLRSRSSGRDRALLDLYKQRLKALGFEYTTEDDRLITSNLNHALYYLVFVSKVPPAKRIMDSVFGRPTVAGQARLTPVRDESSQARLL
jgi:three-Cys-motif partner protein